MSGKTELMLYFVTALCVISAVTDLLWGRIFNWVTLPALLAGLFFAAWGSGWGGLGQALLGAGVALGLYGWMFWLGLMGGGDLKLMMALGAWGGTRFALQLALLSLLLGGVFAFLHLAAKGRLRGFLQRLYLFLLSVFVKELELQAPELDRKLTFPFGVPIAVAGIWLLHSDPFEKLLGGL